MKGPDSDFWREVWAATARSIGDHVAAGCGHLLTEDTLRFAAVRALEGAGAPAARKYPRDARGPISPDTMTLGEMFSDFHRVARLPVHHAWVVELVGDRLRGYLARVADRHRSCGPRQPAPR